MRRHRPARFLPTILALAIGLAIVPTAANADEGTEPVDADEPPAPTTPPTSEPEGEPTTPPETTPEPPEPTTPPTSDPESEPTTVVDTPPTTVDPSPDAPTSVPEREPAPTVTAPVPPEESPASPEPAPTTAPARPADEEELDGDASALPDERVVRPIAFPVLGPVRYSNGWGDCRDGCVRRHQGTDMIGVRMQPLLAAVDGTITRIRHENVGKAGSIVTVRDADGWTYNYFHVNNDTPGSDDGAAAAEWQVAPQLSVGSTVQAGQVIAYMGDSGNAEGSVPHLHFEIRQPGGTPVNPYPSLMAAQQRQSCTTTAGVLTAPDAPASLSPAAVAIIPIAGGGRWLIDRDGRLFAEGSASRIASASGGACDAVEPAIEAATPADDASPITTPAASAEPAAPAGDATPTAAPVVPVALTIAAPVADLAAAAPADSDWTVERGQSLWHIVQSAYAVSDVRTTMSLIESVFDANRDQLTDPDVLNVGVTIRLPA